jgi:enoyl-CoA hydratase
MPMNNSQTVRSAIEDGVLWITLDHPPTNALDPQTLHELEAAVDAFLADASCRVAIIASANRAIFSTGADLPVYAAMSGQDEITGYIRRGQALMRKITASPKPFIAALNGLALGGAFEMALACQLRVAYEHAKLGLPEINYGIIPGWGGTQTLTPLVGPALAAEMILTGETITGREALQHHLVNRAVPRGDVLPLAKDLAAKIAAKNGDAISAALDAIRAAGGEGGWACETEHITALLQQGEILSGIRAMVEKKDPQ